VSGGCSTTLQSDDRSNVFGSCVANLQDELL
jgi:hypothetical protein